MAAEMDIDRGMCGHVWKTACSLVIEYILTTRVVRHYPLPGIKNLFLQAEKLVLCILLFVEVFVIFFFCFVSVRVVVVVLVAIFIFFFVFFIVAWLE